MEGLRIALRKRGITVTTVCPGFVATSIVPMDSPAPFQVSAEAAARTIARTIVRRRDGLVCFPRPMAALMSLISRLPDSVVARLVRHDAGAPTKAATDAG
jgi:NAD(P)-dependent dehydrogenase (short-subunit alcohol dehydrogenase family)